MSVKKGLGENIEKLSKRKKVPSVPDPAEVVAILCSDLHLCARPPLARSVEDDWMAVQRRGLKFLDGLCFDWEAPLIIAGDIFDKPNVPASVVNLAIEHLPEEVYAIPGQHDLPFHNSQDIKDTSYGTLELSDRIRTLSPVNARALKNDWRALGYGWEVPISKHKKFKNVTGCKWLAVCHSYIWEKFNTSYQGAPASKHLIKYLPPLKGFNAAVFGDNHKGFIAQPNNKEPWIMNCGTFFRRNIDEITYIPRVGLLLTSGEIQQVHTNCGNDKFLQVSDALEALDKLMDAGDFLRELKSIGGSLIDFKEAVMRFCEKNGLGPLVKDFLKEVLDK
jgi:hypothetical protein